MSMVNQTPQRARRQRLVIAGMVGTLLLGSAVYAGGRGGGKNGGYNDRLSGLEIAAIATGAIGGGLVIADMFRGRGNRGEDEETSRSKAKAAKAGTVKEVRVRSSQNELTSGDAALVQVEARYDGSSAWQNVTESARIKSSGALTQIDGSRNAFAVPYGSKVASQSATIEATFGGRSATTAVALK